VLSYECRVSALAAYCSALKLILSSQSADIILSSMKIPDLCLNVAQVDFCNLQRYIGTLALKREKF
jgi:hypothetical protein